MESAADVIAEKGLDVEICGGRRGDKERERETGIGGQEPCDKLQEAGFSSRREDRFSQQDLQQERIKIRIFTL